MGVAFSLQLDDLAPRGAVAGWRQALSDLRPMLADIGAELESSTLNRFDSNLAPDGAPWKPSLHSQVTGMPTLVGEGNLRDSVHYVLDGDEAVEIGAGGVARDYAAIHQVGGVINTKGGALAFTLATGQFIRAKSVSLPARPYLGLSSQDEAAIPQIALEHLVRAAAVAVL
ncbi:phage virion morphogenesis protein [Phenylobacterium ferrooxidans]|uniref:Phage virion morphogenesis protein n=1 Tax=Phenylobacterium ferrooxidans TaxID=2982689 RepID=A0ABW6CJS5_9CAUL